MIQIKALAQEIENELNGNLTAVAEDIKFKIHPTVGNFKKATTNIIDCTKQKYVNGVLRSSTGSYVPVKDLNNLLSSLMLELAVPQDKVDKVELIMSTWTESIIGNIYTIDGWNLLITPQLATPGTARDTTPMGSMVPFLCVLQMQFIKDGLISNSIDWEIDGQTIKPLSVVKENNRTPDIKPVANKLVCQTNNQYEVESIVMTIPISYTNIIKQLLNDIANHRKDKSYIITRDDGFSDETSGTYVIGHSTINEESEKIASINITFNPTTTPIKLFFNSDGGSEEEPIEVYYNQTIGKLPTPTKPGSMFQGWKLGEDLISEDTVFEFNENKTVVAQWVEIINFSGLDVNGNITTIEDDIVAYMVGDNTTTEGNGVPIKELEELVIPSEYNNKPVTKIGQHALSTMEYLKRITLPSSIEDIGMNAFLSDIVLEEINLGITNITRLRSSVFRDCISLEQIELPTTLQRIDMAFEGCHSLKELDIPSSVTYLGDQCFAELIGLMQVNIRTTTLERLATTTGRSWFIDCANSLELHIPMSVIDPSTTYGQYWNYYSETGTLTYIADL